MKRSLLLLILFFPFVLQAATPTFDVATSSVTNPPSFAHVTTTNSNRIIFCECRYIDATDSIASMTYGGTGMAAVTARQTPGGNYYQEWWYVKNPATGSNTLAATLSGTMSWIHCTAYTFYNVDQTTPLGTPNKAAAIATGATVDVSSATGELVVDAVANFAGGGPPLMTAGANQTELFQHVPSGDSRGAGSTENGATTVTMSWTWTGSQYGAIMAVALKPSADSSLIMPILTSQWRQRRQ